MPSVTDPAEILEIHKGYADEFTSLAQNGLQAAFAALSQSGIFNYTPTAISISMPSFGTPDNVGPLPNLPIDPELPDEPDLLDFVDVPNPQFPLAPNNSVGTPPAFQSPAKPSGGVPNFTTAAPVVSTTIDLPVTPSYLTLPSLTLPYPTINLPVAPSLAEPTLEGVRPGPLMLPDAASLVGDYITERDAHRTMLPAWVRANAESLINEFVPEFDAVRSQLNTFLSDYLNPTTGGGAGIPAHLENAIQARNSDRNNVEFQRAVETATETIAKRGFTLPPGAVNALVKQARLGMGDAQVRGSVEIATKNLELEQRAFEFVLKLSQSLQEKVLEVVTQWLDLSLKMDAQAIASAKEIVATTVAAYNLQVMVYKAQWEGYQSDVEAFKARIAAMENRVRLFEGEIKAELAKTEVNTAHVNVLRAVADVNQSLASSYRTQVEAATAVLEVARIQMGIFEARVRAYAAEVQGYEARWRAYSAEVEGEVGKQKGFEAQANAYAAQVNGYRAQIDGYRSHVEGITAINNSRTQRNDGSVRVYSAQVEAALKMYEGLVAGYTAETNALIKQSDIEVEYWRTSANLIFQEWQAALNSTFEYAREQMNLFRGQMEAAISAGNGLAHVANVAGNLAGGAMTGLTSFAGTLVNAEAS